jgi:hypothetical protein
MKNEDLMRQIEERIHSLWKDQPATSKQKQLLKKLGVPIDKNLTKDRAFFLLRAKINGIRFPNDFV